MLRMLLCAALALTFVSLGYSEEKKKGPGVAGKIKKVDADKGTITVTVMSKKDKDGKDMEFKVDNDTKITVLDGDEKKELMGKDGLKNDKFKEGAMVMVTADDAGKVSALRIGAPKKKDK